MGSAPPPADAAVKCLGLHFPSPVGLGPGIEVHGQALDFFQDHFGFGFLHLGPVGAVARPARRETEPRRIDDRRAIVWSGEREGPGAGSLAARVRACRARRLPIGFALHGEDLPGAIAAAGDAVDFFSISLGAAPDVRLVEQIRSISNRPLLVRLAVGIEAPALQPILEAGIAGCIAGTGEPTELVPDGEVEGPFLKERAMAQVRAIHDAFGDRCPIIAAGGIETPQDARDFLAAGARLVQVASGFVYAGPGLAARIVKAGRDAEHEPAQAPVQDMDASVPRNPWGPRLVALTGWILAASGVAVIVLASTVQLLPPDVGFLGMNVRQLCARHGCRIVHFMAHDRVSFGGSILSIGLIYHWLATVPLRRGEAWAFWGLCLSGTAGFASFLTYLGYGYLDLWHGLATLALLPVFVVGMALSWGGLRGSRSVRSLLRPGAPAWFWSSANMGRLGVGFAALSMILGGLVIMVVGVTSVFVSTDLEFIGTTAAEIEALNPRLIPLIAHDRAGFGGGLFSGGIAIMAALWCGARPGARALWWVLFVAGIVGFGSAIGVHPIVGYVSFIHLLPACLGAVAFLWGMARLRPHLCWSSDATRFSDF